jgi:hypothetical protein
VDPGELVALGQLSQFSSHPVRDMTIPNINTVLLGLIASKITGKDIRTL